MPSAEARGLPSRSLSAPVPGGCFVVSGWELVFSRKIGGFGVLDKLVLRVGSKLEGAGLASLAQAGPCAGPLAIRERSAGASPPGNWRFAAGLAARTSRITRGRGGWLGLTPQRTFTSYLLPACPGALSIGSSAEIAASSAPPQRAHPTVPIEPGQPEPSTIRAVSELRIGAHRL